jgi:POT family proton-dependent oligopeptide transporter
MRFFPEHPAPLATLVFTEAWERFSYYGMRALLFLFMVAPLAEGGLGFDIAKAGIIYGIYTGSAYLATVPGGWIADRYLGLRRAVVWGAIAITAGHFSLTSRAVPAFYAGLVLIVAGTGLLKSSVSALVGLLYEPADCRRDDGYALFYMGINVGALAAPIACAYVSSQFGWHAGFGLAAVGMCAGLAQYVRGMRGLPIAPPAERRGGIQSSRWMATAAFMMIAAVGTILFVSTPITAQAVGNIAGFAVLGIALLMFANLHSMSAGRNAERRAVRTIALLFVLSALFWSLFEQSGSTLTLFAQNSTDRTMFGFTMPAGWFLSINSIFVITLAPLSTWVWRQWGRTELHPTTKFGLALLFVGSGFAVMLVAALTCKTGSGCSPWWLISTYLLHTIGELCLGPVGLSAMSQLAPRGAAGLMMGLWYLSVAVGNYAGGRVASLYESVQPSTIFGTLSCVALVAGAAQVAVSARRNQVSRVSTETTC